jgi:hypothetical protein
MTDYIVLLMAVLAIVVGLIVVYNLWKSEKLKKKHGKQPPQ